MADTVRILFVDDEPAIRASLPAILRMHGFDVTSAGTVGEAVQAIATKSFDVLISDLNIGSPGDGFTVVSAMRRTQPNCVTLILTGYPAFETALQAIRSQVDDYLIKPAGVQELVAAIESKLCNRTPHRLERLKRVLQSLERLKRVLQILRENLSGIVDQVLDSERRILEMAWVHLTEDECRRNAESFIQALVSQIAGSDSHLSPQLVELSRLHGQARYQQGYTAPMLVENRYLCAAILDCIHSNLLIVDVSQLVPDLKMLSNILASMLREAIAAHSNIAHAA